jgi:hypothetical protein
MMQVHDAGCASYNTPAGTPVQTPCDCSLSREGTLTHTPIIVRCRSCGASIVWLNTDGGRNMPVNADTVQDGETLFVWRRHVSHFASCPHSNQWRKPR